MEAINQLMNIKKTLLCTITALITSGMLSGCGENKEDNLLKIFEIFELTETTFLTTISRKASIGGGS